MTSGQQQRSYSLCRHASSTYCSRKTHHPSSSLAHHFTSHNCLRMVFSEFLVLLQDTQWTGLLGSTDLTIHCCKIHIPIVQSILFMYRRRVCVHVSRPFLPAGLVTAALNLGSVEMETLHPHKKKCSGLSSPPFFSLEKHDAFKFVRCC
jgi:hypothetical protein